MSVSDFVLSVDADGAFTDSGALHKDKRSWAVRGRHNIPFR